MPFQENQFGHKSYSYEPRTDELVERNPDRLRSVNRLFVVERGRDLLWMMEVRGLGVLTMRAGSDRETGRLVFNGVGIHTDEEIKFD